jgi:phage baseplate assembly protein V
MSDLFGSESVEALSRTVSQLIRVGEVSSIDPVKHTARVTFPEEDNSTSYDLAVLVRNSYDNHDYNMPDIGEDVLCLFLPNGHEDGFILGSFYAGQIKPPTTNKDERKVEFSDGTTVTYNRSTHELDVVIEGTQIHADRQTVDITTPKTVNITTTDATVTASGNIKLSAGDNIDIKAGGVVTIQGSTVNIN